MFYLDYFFQPYEMISHYGHVGVLAARCVPFRHEFFVDFCEQNRRLAGYPRTLKEYADELATVNAPEDLPPGVFLRMNQEEILGTLSNHNPKLAAEFAQYI